MSAEPITCSELGDYEWLSGDEAAALAAELADCSEPLHVLVGRLRKRLSASRAHLLLELVELRRRAAGKFSHANRMFFTRLGLEQATDEWVARYKASRFVEQRAGPRAPLRSSGRAPTAPVPIVADLCCGIGGDLLALAEHGPVIGVDKNPIVAHLAMANARAMLPKEFSDRVTLSINDVADFDATDVAAWHIDPDRRPACSRTTSPEWSSPGREVIERLLSQQPNGAIKLAPAADVPHEWTDRCELEWISRDRQCRQLVAWHGALAQSPGQHRATILAARGLALRTVTGQPNQPISTADNINHYVFDVDPAVTAARLTGALAAESDLAALAPGPTYLTGGIAIHDAALACFEVEEVLPLQPKTLAGYLRERNIGQLEVKKRGVEIDPEQFRRELKPRGDQSATLLITDHANRHIAIVAQRVAYPT